MVPDAPGGLLSQGLQYAALVIDSSPPRSLATAEVLSIGSELLVGETRDTNSGDIVRALAGQGVAVRRIQALPDELDVVRAAFVDATAAVDLVVSTGGLGPTPDDLTREAIAAALGEVPVIDPKLETWLRGRWTRRRIPFPAINLKQAWLIPSAVAIPNENGTAPGWWVDRGSGPIVVALPGPPSEMRPMWEGWVLPRLAAAGLGVPRDVRTLRLSGIGESQLADRLGEEILRSKNPMVATYARADAVDVRISAVDEPARVAPGSDADPGSSPRAAADLADEAEARIMAVAGAHVWARGATTWPMAIDAALAGRGWTLAIVETGAGGSVAGLLGTLKGLAVAEVRSQPNRRGTTRAVMIEIARERAATAGADVGVAVEAVERDGDLRVTIGVAAPDGDHVERRTAFLGGEQGRARVAVAAADVLLAVLRRSAPPG